MSSLVILNRFDGGHAEDIRTTAVNECEKSLNFDLFTNPHKLIPYPDSVAETTNTYTMDDIELSDIDVSLIGASYTLTASGYETSSSTKPTFWTKSALTNGSTLDWSSQAVAAGNVYQKNSGVVYKDKFYALGYNGSGTYSLYRYDSAGSVTTVGTISSSSTFYAKPFVHPEDNVLYIVIGTTITSWNNTTLTTTTTILPSGYECVSLTDYGTYLAIAMRPLRSNGVSTVYLWGRDATINTLQAQIDFGEGNILILENLNNILVAVLIPQNTFSTTIQNKIKIRVYAGGAVETIKSLLVSSVNNPTSLKVKNGNKLYFGFGTDDCVYVFGKNKAGRYIVTKDKYYFNGTSIGSLLGCLSMIGDVMWRGFATVGGVFTLMRSKINALSESFTYNSTSTYKTTINPNMAEVDRYKLKQLDAVQISYTGSSSGTTVLKYSADGSAMTTIISATNATGEQVYEAAMQDDGQPFLEGREFQFQIESTGGSEIKEIRYKYTVLTSAI